MNFCGQNLLDFMAHFPDEISCLAYLAYIKWADKFVCSKCGHDKFTIRKKNLARDCNRCHHIESPTAGTLFHRVRFGLRKAFAIVFEMSATTKSLSSSIVAKRYGISRTTAWTFMHKVRISMKSSMANPLTGKVQVDEFVFGGKENLKQGRSHDAKRKKIVAALETSKTGGIKRVYFQRIADFSSKSLRKIFDNHISAQASVRTDHWTGYIPIAKDYNFEQKISGKKKSMKQMHLIVHQVKAWLRCTFSWVHEGHIEKYLDEFSFRINRSIHRQNSFHSLIQRMIIAKPTPYQAIKIST